jgi:hypothetical protein
VKLLNSPGRSLRGRPGLVAILLLGLGWGLMIHTTGWAQSSHYAQTRALAAGRAEIDTWHWEGKDKAWIDGHFYSVKAPGLAIASLPAFELTDSGAVRDRAATAAANARRTPEPRWTSRATDPYADHGFNQARAETIGRTIENYTPMIWVLALSTSVLPALALLLLVRWIADRLVPGYGTLAAITLGLATILMSFASIYTAHALAATLAFAAFALLFREREDPAQHLLWVGVAGLLAGFAVTTEYPAGIAGAVLFFYALGGDRRLPRGSAYALGAVVGALPALIYNAWALGSPLDFAYSAAVATQGLSGHAEVGLNSDGFFGISFPRVSSVGDLLFASRGLLVATPVIGAAIAGLTLMGGKRSAELRVIVAIAAAYFIYNSGYWLPFGGGTPGPRFLIVALPFVAIGLAYAYRRWPAVSLGLALPSAVIMLVASLTFPLIGENGTGTWVERIFDEELEHTALTALGVSNPFLAVLPVLAAVGLAVAVALRSAPRISIGEVRWAIRIVAGWMLLATLAPTVVGDPATPLQKPAILILVWGSGAAAIGTLAWLRYRELAPGRAAISSLEPATGESIS